MLNKRNFIILTIIVLTSLMHAAQLDLRNAKSIYNNPQISGTGNGNSSLQTISGVNSAVIREKITDEGSVIEIQDTDYFINQQLPIIPQINLQVTLDGYVDVTAVDLIAGNVAQSRTEGQILSHFQQVEWSINSDKNQIKRSPSPEVYQTDNFFPTQWLNYTAGFDGKVTKVFIQLYPFQWNPQSLEVLYLTDYTISINGTQIEIPKIPGGDSRTDAEHIIITPTDWITSANDLADFHANNGISTEVIELADISLNYEPAEEPTEAGYATMASPVNANYNYELAKKIISYLRDTEEHPNLEMVTLLGSGEFTPPSYYFYNSYAGDYSAWIPSDHYFSSPDYDWVDNFAVCRVPVHNESDLITFITKLEIVSSHFGEDWVENVTLSGGDAFDNDFYTGEMIDNMAICQDLCDEMIIKKYQRYENRFHKTAFVDHMQNDDYLMNLHICHGSGDAIHFDSGQGISGSEMLSYSTKDKLPIFLTVACMNGAFDTQLHNGGFSLSFSEGMIASPGAGIAYVGGSRNNGGVPSHVIDNGNLSILGIDDTALLLLNYMQAYRDATEPTIGRLSRNAKDQYLAACNMNLGLVKAAFVRFVTHGSAALQLPVAPDQNPETTIPTISVANSTGVNGENYQTSEIQSDEELYFVISDDEMYNLQTVEISSGGAISTENNIQTIFDLEVPFGESVVLNKVINEEEKEAWHYSVVYRNRLKHVDGNLEDWNLDEIIASDEMNDIIPGIFDLTTLYAAYDDVFEDIYFAFPESFSEIYVADIYKTFYVMAIDDVEGGISNNFENIELFPVNSYLGFSGAEIDKMLVVTLTVMNGDINSEVSFYIYDEDSYEWTYNQVTESAIVDGGIEIRIPASYFNYQNCQVSFVSSAWELLPTQQYSIIADAVPTDNACLPDLTFGVENAITVSEYFDFGLLVDTDDLTIHPNKISLNNYPNPFNPNTTIKFNLTSDEPVEAELAIYNLKGQKVKQLVNAKFSQGTHSVTWQGKDDNNKQVGSGIYFAKLKAGSEIQTTKLLLIK
jgi:Peptidase family C25/FlgD Ig-like domain